MSGGLPASSQTQQVTKNKALTVPFRTIGNATANKTLRSSGAHVPLPHFIKMDDPSDDPSNDPSNDLNTIKPNNVPRQCPISNTIMMETSRQKIHAPLPRFIDFDDLSDDSNISKLNWGTFKKVTQLEPSVRSKK